MQEFKVSAADVGQRADVFVANQYPDFTRSSLERLFKDGLVTIQDKPAKPSDKIKLGGKVSVDEAILKAKPPMVNLPVIYEDGDVIVINKPAGLLSHSKGALNLEATVASFVAGKITDVQLTGNRAGIVHRLDRATSGVMIAAKNSAAHSKLQKQFAQRKTKKQYLAVVEGLLEPTTAVIDTPIGRNPNKPQTFKVMPSGKPAQTEYKTLKTFTKNNITYSLLELKPHTGRTHQLRVHLSYIGHPIVGDHIYGVPGDNLMLHAASLEITLPSSERKVFTADPPATFKEFAEL